MRSILIAAIFVFFFNQGYTQDRTGLMDSLMTQLVTHSQYDKFDSLKTQKKDYADSLRNNLTHKIDSGIVSINHLVDSLNSIDISGEQYRNTLTNAYSKFGTSVLGRAKDKRDSLDEKFNSKIEELEATIKHRKTFIDSVLNANEMASIKMPQDISAKLPELKGLNSLDLPDVGLNKINIPSLDITQIGKPNLNVSLPKFDVGGFESIEQINKAVSELKQVSSQAMGYQQDIAKLKAGDLSIIDKTIDQQLGKVGEVGKLKQKISEAESVKKNATELVEKMQDQEALQDEMKKKAKRTFVDYFAGHEDKIKSEIESMEKLQRKYHSVTDVRYLPKHRTNPEKGKPFFERVIIGTEFQIDRRDPVWTGVDVSPYLGYKFSDRFRANVGGTYRVTFDTKTLELSNETESYGYRAFGNYKIINGLFAHLEVENMYRIVPPYYAAKMNLPNPESATWIPRAFIGIYKTYTISKHFNGQTQILYDFLDVAKNFQFNKVAFRFGFEYKFVKKNKEKKSKVVE